MLLTIALFSVKIIVTYKLEFQLYEREYAMDVNKILNELENEEENEEEVEIYTLTDEDGNELEFTLVGTVEMKGNKYLAMIPSDLDEDSEYLEYVILKSVIEDGEEVLISVDDDDEYDDVADYFDDLFANEIDLDAPQNN